MSTRRFLMELQPFLEEAEEDEFEKEEEPFRPNRELTRVEREVMAVQPAQAVKNKPAKKKIPIISEPSQDAVRTDNYFKK